MWYGPEPSLSLKTAIRSLSLGRLSQVSQGKHLQNFSHLQSYNLEGIKTSEQKYGNLNHKDLALITYFHAWTLDLNLSAF